MTWIRIEGITECGYTVTHILPEDEQDIHVLTDDCWCEPSLDDEFWIATHNSVDGREKFETGERKLS